MRRILIHQKHYGALMRLALCMLLVLSAAGCATLDASQIASDAAPSVSLQSAFLLRESGRMHEPPPASDAERVALLRSHFAAIAALLEQTEENSLDLALHRLERLRNEHWTQAERGRWRAALRERRGLQLARLRSYAKRGRFPENTEQGSPWVPVFVDEQDTACAVGYLMRESGWHAAVAEIAHAANGVYVSDVQAGELLAWIAASGLTREEAALIQPGYPPPTTDVTLADLISGDSLSTDRLLYSNFSFAYTEVPKECPTARSPYCDPAQAPIPLEPAAVGIAAFTGVPAGEYGDPLPVTRPYGDWLFLNTNSSGAGVSFTITYDVSTVQSTQAIDTVDLVLDYFMVSAQSYVLPDPYDPFAPEPPLEELVLTTRVFAGPELLAELVTGDDSFGRIVDRISGRATAALLPRRTLRIETEASVRGPAFLNHFSHEFRLITIPEPATGLSFALGLIGLALSRRH